jgi:hypothetical protein
MSIEKNTKKITIITLLFILVQIFCIVGILICENQIVTNCIICYQMLLLIAQTIMYIIIFKRIKQKYKK